MAYSNAGIQHPIWDKGGAGKHMEALASALVGDGLADDTAALQAVLTAIGSRTQSGFSRFPDEPLQTVFSGQKTYLVTSTLTLKSLASYDFGNSRILFRPTTANDNLFEAEDAWSLATYPTAMHIRIKRVFIEGDWEKTTNVGNAYACFYFPRSSSVIVEDFSVIKFQVGAQFGLDIGEDYSSHVGNYYNGLQRGEIASCGRGLISNSAANYYTDVIFRTGSGAYESPPAALVHIGATGNAFANCDFEIATTAGFGAVFDLEAGSVNVHGGYVETGGNTLARINAAAYVNSSKNIIFDLAHNTPDGFLWYNDGAAAELTTRTRYAQLNTRQRGAANFAGIRYNRVTGEGIARTGFNAPVAEWLNRRAYPKFVETTPDAGTQVTLTLRLPAERYGFLHVIMNSGPTQRLENASGLAYSPDQFGLRNHFEDAGVYHYSVALHDYEQLDGLLRFQRTGGDIILYNIYFSNSPTYFTLDNQTGSQGDADPTFGNWEVGERLRAITPAVAGYAERVCTVAGTGGALGVSCTATSGSAVVEVADATGIEIGQHVKLDAHSTRRRVKSISGTTVTMDNVFYYTGATTLEFVAPTFKPAGIVGLEQTAASADTASAVGATYDQAEVQAILTELRDLKAKMRTAGALAT